MYGKSKTINFCVEKVIFNGPATIVIWGDGTKTVVKCANGDSYSKWAGLAMCIAKHLYGDDFHHQFRNFCGAESLSKTLEGYCKMADYRDVIFKDTFDAGLVLKNMRNIIDTFGFVSVADCSRLVGAMVHFGDQDIGWVDISKAMIIPAVNGYLIKYPEPASRSQPNEVKDLD